jgi:hypothetical protein
MAFNLELVLGISAIVLATYTAFLQRRHNFLSLKPIGQIKLHDYENRVAVRVANAGLGPLVIKRFEATDGSREFPNLISAMPDLGSEMLWETYFDELLNVAVLPGEEAVILALSGPASDENYLRARTLVRHRLSELTVKIYFEDAYGRSIKPVSRSLDWFGQSKAKLDNARP